jgi:hypothetical protein
VSICHDSFEDICHVIHCPKNPERICINQDKILHRVKKYGDIQLEVKTILQSLKSKRSPKDHTDLHSQQYIGWTLFLQGKVTTEISPYITHKMKKPGTEQKCVIAICHLVITQWKRAWLYRVNNQSRTAEKEILVITKNQLRHIYNYQKHLTPENQQYLLNTFTAHTH